MKKLIGVPLSLMVCCLLLLWLVLAKHFVDGFTPLRFAGKPGKSLSRALSQEIRSCGPLGFRARATQANLPANRKTSAIATKRAITTTQLSLTVVLPLPVPSMPRLGGQALRIAESWAPSVGVLTSTLLYLAPARAVWRAIRRARYRGFEDEDDDDGDGEGRSNIDDPMYGLNPLPIAIMPFVALSWLAYGFASSDPFLILGNLLGTFFSVAYLIGILPLMNYNSTIFPTLPNFGIDNVVSENKTKIAKANNKQNNKNIKKRRSKPKKSKILLLTHATVLLSTASTLALWAILGLMTAGATDGSFSIGGLEFGMGLSSAARNGVIAEALGVYAASLFLLLSGSPLFMIRDVVRTKNSRMILGQLTAAQCVNTGLWTAYGFAVSDHFVWGPNIIGLSLGLIQLTLKILYPSKKKRSRRERRLGSTLIMQ